MLLRPGFISTTPWEGFWSTPTYAHVIYAAGPRELHHLQAFLTHTGQLLRLRGWHNTGQLLRLRGWHKILGDQRLMAPFTPEEGQWIVDYWLTAEQRGVATIYGAILVPNDVFARLSVSQVMTEARAAALAYRMFDAEEAAQRWLRQLP